MDLTILAEAFKPLAKLLLILAALVFIMICLDYLTGSIAARKNGTWSSKIAREGIWHKVGIMIALMLSVLLDVVVLVASRSVLNLPIAFYGLFAPLVALCYTLTEFGSILENLHKMDVYVPSFLMRGFASIKNVVDSHAEATIPHTEAAIPSQQHEPLDTENIKLNE